MKSPPKIKPKLTIGTFEKIIFDIRSAASQHPILTLALVLGIIVGGTMWGRRRIRTRKGGFFRLDEKDGLLGGNSNGKVD